MHKDRKQLNYKLEAVLGRIYGYNPPAVFGAPSYSIRKCGICQ